MKRFLSIALVAIAALSFSHAKAESQVEMPASVEATMMATFLPSHLITMALDSISGVKKEVVVAAKPDAALYKFTGEATPALEDAAAVFAETYAAEGIELTDEQIVDLILVF